SVLRPPLLAPLFPYTTLFRSLRQSPPRASPNAWQVDRRSLFAIARSGEGQSVLLCPVAPDRREEIEQGQYADHDGGWYQHGVEYAEPADKQPHHQRAKRCAARETKLIGGKYAGEMRF